LIGVAAGAFRRIGPLPLIRSRDASCGSVPLDWAFKVSSYLKDHRQLFSGYGERLIDFNHRQTAIGLGISLAQWL